MTFGFAQPWALLLLLALPAYWLITRRWPRPALAFSRAATVGKLAKRRRLAGRLPDLLRAIAVVGLVIALAAPRTGVSAIDTEAEGIAIMLVVDVSTSMLAEDFAPHNRIAVAREKVRDFIRGRRFDRIGMVVFAGEALTQVPLTVDYDVLFKVVEQMNVLMGDLEDGTAIGTAIATGANRLRDAQGRSKVMILMTDGENNRGQVDPVTAARAAEAFGVKIYTIGVGSEGVAPVPIARGLMGGYQYANLPVHIDERLLREVASLSGGRYFRATHAQALDSIYHRIDELEKTRVQVRRYVDYTPRYLPFVVLAALCLLLEWALRGSRWGRVP